MPCVIGIARWSTEHRQDPVAHEVLNHAVARQDDVDHGGEVVVQKHRHMTRSHLLGHRRVAAKIGAH
jgi:hypothetical protein